jgi:hypothetical protein
MLTNKNVWKAVGLFFLVSMPTALLVLVAVYYFTPADPMSISAPCFFAAGSGLGSIFVNKFKSLQSREFLHASITYVSIDILLGVVGHPKPAEIIIFAAQDIIFVLGVYAPLRAKFREKTL